MPESQLSRWRLYFNIRLMFLSPDRKGLVTDIECEARDRDHLNCLIAALRDEFGQHGTVPRA